MVEVKTDEEHEAMSLEQLKAYKERLEIDLKKKALKEGEAIDRMNLDGITQRTKQQCATEFERTRDKLFNSVKSVNPNEHPLAKCMGEANGIEDIYAKLKSGYYRRRALEEK